MNTRSTGVGLLCIIFVLFLGLKLGSVGMVAEWSWWWVFAPLWLPAVIGLIFVSVLGMPWLMIYAARRAWRSPTHRGSSGCNENGNRSQVCRGPLENSAR